LPILRALYFHHFVEPPPSACFNRDTYQPLVKLSTVSVQLLAGCSAYRRYSEGGGVSRRSYCKGELLGVGLILAGCEGSHVVERTRSIDSHLTGILCISRSGLGRCGYFARVHP